MEPEGTRRHGCFPPSSCASSVAPVRAFGSQHLKLANAQLLGQSNAPEPPPRPRRRSVAAGLVVVVAPGPPPSPGYLQSPQATTLNTPVASNPPPTPVLQLRRVLRPTVARRRR